MKTRAGLHAKEQNGPQRQRQATIEEGEKKTSPAQLSSRPNGGDEVQIDVIHGIDVGHQTAEQVSSAKTRKGSRGERGERKEPDPQPGQHPRWSMTRSPCADWRGAHDGEETQPLQGSCS